jgi:hypothetical protein
MNHGKFYNTGFVIIFMEKEEHSSYGTAALVLGIIAIVAAWIPFLGLLISIIALVISIVAIKKHEKHGTAGLILSIISILIAFAFTIMTGVLVHEFRAVVEEGKENAKREQEKLEEHNLLCNQSSAKVFSNCKNIINNGDPKNKIDMTFVAINYTSTEEIYSEIDANLHSNGKMGEWFFPFRGLFEIEPFKSNRDKFNIYVIENTCSDLDDVYKNTTLFINKVVSSCPDTDQIAVIVNTNSIPYIDNHFRFVGGWAIVDKGAPVGFLITSSKNNITHIIHEFGHSFGYLCDEYLSQEDDFSKPLEDKNVDCPNCAAVFSGDEGSSCPKWDNVLGAGCYEGCGYANLYRSEPISIMGVPDSNDEFIEMINLSSDENMWREYNLVSKSAIEKRLAEYS